MVTDVATAAVFEPVQAPTTFEETVERLGTAIPTLVQSGHLTSVRGRGGGTFVVQEPPLAEGHPGGALRSDWREVLDLREAVEIGVVTLAAERADPEALDIMRD